MTAAPEHATFVALVGAQLTLETAEGHALPARLVDCTLTDPASGSFTLDMVAGPDGPGQGAHVLRADGLPATVVFLVPSRRDAEGTTYHAVFNLQKPTDTKDGHRP